MYDMSSPPLNRSRVILADGSTKKVEFIGRIDPMFHSKTKIPATLWSKLCTGSGIQKKNVPCRTKIDKYIALY